MKKPNIETGVAIIITTTLAIVGMRGSVNIADKPEPQTPSCPAGQVAKFIPRPGICQPWDQFCLDSTSRISCE